MSRPTRSGDQQLALFKKLIGENQMSSDSPVLAAAVKWLKNCPVKLEDDEREELLRQLCWSFGLKRDELLHRIFEAPVERVALEAEPGVKTARQIEDELWRILPQEGFFHDYARYTSHSEAPLAYHVFCALLTVGATINRRCWIDMGYFKLFPPLGVVLLGPSGIKKTSSADIVVGLLQDLQLTKIYSEKLTPEALIEGMRDHAQGLVYAPELAVFLGKQKYNEGMIPLLTRFMDCPDAWASETISRGAKPLANIAISTLMCSTPDWFVENTPQDTFGGGFIARLLLVMQEESPRLVPIPVVGSQAARQALCGQLAQIHAFEGQIILGPEILEQYGRWYEQCKERSKNPEHDLLSTYYQRKPLHVLRIAMIFHVVNHRTTHMCWECVDRAIRLLEWNEQFLPSLLKEMFRTQVGAEQKFILNVIKQQGGVMEHSTLVRKVQYKMSAANLRQILNSLKEAKQIDEKTSPAHVYIVR